MRNLRRFVKIEAHPVPDKFTHHRAALVLGILLDRPADVTDGVAGAHGRNPPAQAFPADGHDLAGIGTGGAHEESFVAVGVVAVEDRGHVDVDDVPVVEHACPGDAVADDFVDRDADALGIAPVVQGCGNGAGGGGEGVHQGIDLLGGDAGPNHGLHPIQNIQRQTAGLPDDRDVLRRLQPDLVFLEIQLLQIHRAGGLFAQAAFLVFQTAAAGGGVVSSGPLVFHDHARFPEKI